MSITGSALWYVLPRMAGAVAGGAIVGAIAGHAVAGAVLGPAAWLGWLLYVLWRIDWWLRHRSAADPPEFPGIPGDIVAQAVRLHRRKRYHKQRLIQLFRQLRRSTAALPDGVVILNTGNEILWFNGTAGRLLGLRRGADLGLRIDNLIRQPEFVRYVGAGQYSSPVVVRPSAGSELFLSAQIVPYGEEQRLLLVRDVTRQMRLEEMRKDFVANASHELRSPLTVISGYLETLAQDPALDEGLRAPVLEMRRQAERMTGIIHDLLELSRLEADENQVDGEPIDVPALVAMLRKDVLARPQRPQDVRVRVESPAHLVGAEPEVHSAFSNLVDNAAKYTPVTGSVEIRWWTDHAGAHFSVTDTGIGIPPEHLPRLTERFYRVDPGRSRATGGSGLGLAIVKHVLQRHGGELEITSEPGRGSAFTCHFPLARVVLPEAAAKMRAG